MLLIIHNLPWNTRYNDVKALLQEKCGLKDLILDNLLNENAGKKVTVGVPTEEDAALLVRKINGLYMEGQQLFVEDVRKEKASQQPIHISQLMKDKAQKNRNDPPVNTSNQYQNNQSQYQNNQNLYQNNQNQYQNNQSQYQNYESWGIQYQTNLNYTAQTKPPTDKYQEKTTASSGTASKSTMWDSYNGYVAYPQWSAVQAGRAPAPLPCAGGGYTYPGTPGNTHTYSQGNTQNYTGGYPQNYSGFGATSQNYPGLGANTQSYPGYGSTSQNYPGFGATAPAPAGGGATSAAGRQPAVGDAQRPAGHSRPSHESQPRSDRAKNREQDRAPRGEAHGGGRSGRGPSPPSRKRRREGSPSRARRSSPPRSRAQSRADPPAKRSRQSAKADRGGGAGGGARKQPSAEEERELTCRRATNMIAGRVLESMGVLSDLHYRTRTEFRRRVRERVFRVAAGGARSLPDIEAQYRAHYDDESHVQLYKEVVDFMKQSSLDEQNPLTKVLATTSKDQQVDRNQLNRQEKLLKNQDNLANNPPGFKHNVPGSKHNVPGSKHNVPGSKPNVPGFKPNVLGSKPNVPGSKPNVPGFKPNVLGSKPNVPGSKPNVPGFKPNVPGSKPNVPSLKPSTSAPKRPKPPKRPALRDYKPPDPEAIPKFIGGNKRMNRLHKEANRKMEVYPLPAAMKRALEHETGEFIKFFDDFRNKAEGDLKTLCDKQTINKMMYEFLQTIRHYVSHRVGGVCNKTVRIFGQPKHPKMEELRQFLKPYRPLNLKKSVKGMYVATLGDYESFDKLCLEGPFPIGNEGHTLTFKPLHIMPVTKFAHGEIMKYRKQYIENQIKPPNINILDKNWQEVERELIRKECDAIKNEIKHTNVVEKVDLVVDSDLNVGKSEKESVKVSGSQDESENQQLKDEKNQQLENDETKLKYDETKLKFDETKLKNDENLHLKDGKNELLEETLDCIEIKEDIPVVNLDESIIGKAECKDENKEAVTSKDNATSNEGHHENQDLDENETFDERYDGLGENDEDLDENDQDDQGDCDYDDYGDDDHGGEVHGDIDIDDVDDNDLEDY